MSTYWVHVETEALEAGEGAVVLSSEEARHVQARRLRVGDALTAFDGEGRVASARVVSLARRETVIELDSVTRAARPDDDFVLASAVPKGDRLSTLLQMLTQLGVVLWQPLLLDDSAVRKLDAGSPRLRRVLVESAKVARRPYTMRIDEPLDLGGALERHGERADTVWFGDREGEATVLPDTARLLLIGPEAGFSVRERARLERAGARPIAFSPYNLRIEVAAIAGATAHAIGGGARWGIGGGAG